MDQVRSYTAFRFPENERLNRDTAHPVAIPGFLTNKSYSAARIPVWYCSKPRHSQCTCLARETTICISIHSTGNGNGKLARLSCS